MTVQMLAAVGGVRLHAWDATHASNRALCTTAQDNDAQRDEGQPHHRHMPASTDRALTKDLCSRAMQTPALRVQHLVIHHVTQQPGRKLKPPHQRPCRCILCSSR